MAVGENIDLNALLRRMEALPGIARLGILGGIAAVIVGLYFFTMFGGARSKLQTVDRQLAKVESDIQSARAVASNLDNFKREQEELKQELQAALQKLPRTSDLPQLLTDISSLGKKSGLEIRTFKRADLANRGFYSEQNILLKFRGEYHDVGIFFDRLSRLSRIVNITSLDMKVAKDLGGSPLLEVSGNASTFFFNDSNSANLDANTRAAGGR